MQKKIGKVGLTPKGEYNPLESYKRLDFCEYNGSSYVCLINGSPIEDWQLLAKKGDDSTSGGSAELLIEITHAELLNLVNTNSLVKGQQYRITDYVATVVANYEKLTGIPARSAGHGFDIIVVADSESVLNENARAVRRNGDTYFPEHVNFASWELKYSIFNNNKKYTWADEAKGRGVVYFMRDEWNNELPYDFKSIQFQRDGIWKYTFNRDSRTDASIENYNAFDNKIGVFVLPIDMDGNMGNLLNNIVFGNNCNSNTFGYSCHSNTFGNECYSNTFGYSCHSNTFGDSCCSNTFGNECYSNTFGNECYSNTFGDLCETNTFGNECYSNTFGDSCNSNTFGDNCYYINAISGVFDKNFSNDTLQNVSFIMSTFIPKLFKVYIDHTGTQHIEEIG